MQNPITDVREISRIAYGFKASKALLVAIDFDLFSHISNGTNSLLALADKLGITENRLDTLLTALTSIGLLSRHDGTYVNAPPDIWRDYASLMGDSDTAERFSKGQHAGSLAPASILSKQIDLGTKEQLLDVAGGSGAFTIMLCKRNPELNATIFDFPKALPVAKRYIDDAGLNARVELTAGNAITNDWPQGHDVVLMSYLFSAVSGEDIGILLSKAYGALPSGGTLVVHDFIADDDKTGPRDAALWFLTCMFNCPDAVVLTPQLVCGEITNAGFSEAKVSDVIPNLTKVFVAHKA
jgi:hypothetical protein